MPVSVMLEYADDEDPADCNFIIVVRFSHTRTVKRVPRTLALAECTTADVEALYARATGEVLRALNVVDWRRSSRVQIYKKRIRVLLRACATCKLKGIFDECSRALYCAAARERGVRHGSHRSAIQAATASTVAHVSIPYPGTCAGCVLAATANTPAVMHTNEDQVLFDASRELPPAQRARYLSLFV